jgi:hypothetical protein
MPGRIIRKRFGSFRSPAEFVVRGLKQRHVARLEPLDQRAPPADRPEPLPRHENGADDQDDGLQAVGHDDGAQPAENRVGAGEERDEDAGAPEIEERKAGRDDDGAGVERPGGVDEEKREEREDGIDDTGAPLEAALEVLGDGVEAVAQKHRQDEGGEEHEDQGRGPLVVEDGDAVGVGGADEADEARPRHVRCVVGEADQVPGQRTAGEKVLG